MSATGAAIRLADDDSRIIDRVGHTGNAARERTNILHRGSIPEESVGLEGRSVGEDGLTDDAAVVVDGEPGGEDGIRQSAQIPDLIIGPTGGVDDPIAQERVAGDLGSGIDLECRTGRASGEGAEIGNGSRGRPFDRDEIGGGLAFHIGIAHDGARIVEPNSSADRRARKGP